MVADLNEGNEASNGIIICREFYCEANVIDAEGFRPNVGIIILNAVGEVLWARRVGGQNAWQFPQGGIKDSEDPEEALYRELGEEVGLTKDSVRILEATRGWLRYRLPAKYLRQQSPQCIGQKQKWFLLSLESAESLINLDHTQSPEFDRWRWASYWYPINNVVSFKREVYRRALKELSFAHARYEESASDGRRATAATGRSKC